MLSILKLHLHYTHFIGTVRLKLVLEAKFIHSRADQYKGRARIKLARMPILAVSYISVLNCVRKLLRQALQYC